MGSIGIRSGRTSEANTKLASFDASRRIVFSFHFLNRLDHIFLLQTLSCYRLNRAATITEQSKNHSLLALAVRKVELRSSAGAKNPS